MIGWVSGRMDALRMDKQRNGIQANVDDKVLSRHIDTQKEKQRTNPNKKINRRTETLAQFSLLDYCS